MIHALLVEDEATLAKIVKESLESREFEVTVVGDGDMALAKFYEIKPDVIVLDVMLPHKDGFTLAKEIRNTDHITPIIFLTAKSQTEDVVRGFNLGGNDYLKKPFSMEELIVRIKALLDQNINNSESERSKYEYRIGEYEFNAKSQVLCYRGNMRELTHRESALLKLLCANKNSVLERKTALLKLWGDDTLFNARSMDVFIAKLRRYLKKDPNVKVINVRGIGFKLID